MKPKFSFITCVSDPKLYDRLLLKSLYSCTRTRHFEVVPILNERNQYSAAAALNLGLENSSGPTVVFCHQDVHLAAADWLDKLDSVVENAPEDWAIISAAGISLQYGREHIGPRGGATTLQTVAVGEVWSSLEAMQDPPYWDGHLDTQPIHCADECLMVFKRSTLLRHDASYDGYHFYGVDLSLQARAAGYGVYGARLPIAHCSQFSASRIADSRYWTYARYLRSKWECKFPEMYGTHFQWDDRGLVSYIPCELEDEYGNSSIKVRAQGIKFASIAGDHNLGINLD